MKTKNRSYQLVFRSRADERVSAAEKYSCFFEAIRKLPPPWGPGDRPIPPAPHFKRQSSASVSLTKFLNDGVRRAMMTFVYRRMLTDNGSSDDLLIITLDTGKLDVHYLIYDVIPEYIQAFNAYRVEYFDDQLIELAYEERQEQGRSTLTAKSKVPTNSRFDVEKVTVVAFYDELLCRRAFNLSPAQVLERLKEKTEYCQLLHGGVYIVGISKNLPLVDAQKLCDEMTAALRRSP